MGWIPWALGTGMLFRILKTSERTSDLPNQKGRSRLRIGELVHDGSSAVAVADATQMIVTRNSVVWCSVG